MGAAAAVDAENRHQAKMPRSLANTLVWLEAHADEAIQQLPPDRGLSFLEVTLYCFFTHLEFRRLLPAEPYPALDALCRRLEKALPGTETAYCFDP